MPTIDDYLDIDGLTLMPSQRKALLDIANGVPRRYTPAMLSCLRGLACVDDITRRKVTPRGIRYLTPGRTVSPVLRAYALAYTALLNAARDVREATRNWGAAVTPAERAMAQLRLDEAQDRGGQAAMAVSDARQAAVHELRAVLEE
jgi:hypothetical protein